MNKKNNALKYYWDTCIFLAWIKDENRPAGEMDGIHEIAKKIHTKEISLITSVMTGAEILRSSLSKEEYKKYEDFMGHMNVLEVETDKKIWNLTHDLRDFYLKEKTKDGLNTLTIPDAVHLATAIHYEIDVFNTFDEKPKNKRRTLIPLNGNVAGNPLKIEKPYSIQPRLGNEI